MEPVLVIVAPGQGAQTPGFLAPWLEDPTFASRFDWLSTVAGLDLAHYGTEADADTIRQTEIAQPSAESENHRTALACRAVLEVAGVGQRLPRRLERQELK